MVRFLILDIDGTLTDGGLYYSENGEIAKKFNVKDGYGIANILPAHNIIPLIITGRENPMADIRAKELGIPFVFHKVKNKKECLDNFIASFSQQNNTSISYKDFGVIGDDIPDLELMEVINKSGGYSGCPNDSVQEIRKTASYISPFKGGYGAVRDFIEFLIRKK
jgi:3-deoxy-D-manno-octulosonate 8-phosphate phosphatase (KDO 8-P phosphatase)